jgi:hypothetical protein
VAGTVVVYLVMVQAVKTLFNRRSVGQ